MFKGVSVWVYKEHISFDAQAVEKVLTGAIRREMALEDICAKHATEIAQLNRLVRYFLLRFHIFFFYSSGSGQVFPFF